MKTPDNIKISQLDKSHIDSLFEIADTQLGKGFIERKRLLSPYSFTNIALEGNELIGFSCGEIQKSRDLIISNGMFPDSIKKLLLKYETIGITKSLAIRNDKQNRGIGTSLFAQRIKNFSRMGAGAIIMPGWQYPDGTTTIDGIARRFGFRKLETVKNYYYHDSIKRQYTCPVCGEPPCKCSAVIYFLDLIEGNG